MSRGSCWRCDGEDAARGATSELLRESWMHIEVDRETDQTRLDAITARLQQILRDVQEVVADWEKMQEQALKIVSDLESSPPHFPTARSTRERRCSLGSPLTTSRFSATASTSSSRWMVRTC